MHRLGRRRGVGEVSEGQQRLRTAALRLSHCARRDANAAALHPLHGATAGVCPNQAVPLPAGWRAAQRGVESHEAPRALGRLPSRGGQAPVAARSTLWLVNPAVLDPQGCAPGGALGGPGLGGQCFVRPRGPSLVRHPRPAESYQQRQARQGRTFDQLVVVVLQRRALGCGHCDCGLRTDVCPRLLLCRCAATAQRVSTEPGASAGPWPVQGKRRAWRWRAAQSVLCVGTHWRPTSRDVTSVRAPRPGAPHAGAACRRAAQVVGRAVAPPGARAGPKQKQQCELNTALHCARTGWLAGCRRPPRAAGRAAHAVRLLQPL